MRDDDGNTPLHLAGIEVRDYSWRPYNADIVDSMLNNQESAAVLLSEKMLRNNYRNTPLHILSANGGAKALTKLLANPEARKLLLREDMFLGSDNNTPLHRAAESNSLNAANTIQALLNDKDVRALAFRHWTNALGKTPIDVAYKSESKGLLKEAYAEYLKTVK